MRIDITIVVAVYNCERLTTANSETLNSEFRNKTETDGLSRQYANFHIINLIKCYKIINKTSGSMIYISLEQEISGNNTENSI